MNSIHPGEILFEEFLTPMHLGQNKITTDIGVHPVVSMKLSMAKEE